MTSRAVAGWVSAFVLAILLFSSTQSVRAATTRTWTGNGTTNDWSDAGNWNSGVPVAGDSLVFPLTANRKSNNNNLASNTAFDTITFNGAGYTLGGNSITLTTELTNQPPSGSNEVALNINGAGEVYQQGARLVLSGNNSYSGTTYVDAGALLALSDTALGSAAGETFVGTEATLQLAGGVDLGAEIVNAGGTGLDDEGEIQSLSGTNFVATVKLFGETTVGVFNSTLVVDLLTVDPSGAGLTLIGGGKLQVQNSFLAGDVLIEHGNFTWNASSQIFVTVEGEGWLRGTGTTSQIDVHGGLVWPGSGNTPGILDNFGSTTFNAGYFRVDIDGTALGTEYGQFETGSLSLNPLATVLEVDLGFAPSVGDVFRIINNTGAGPVVGTFLDLPEGALYSDGGYVWKISYKGGTGNDVTLTVVRQASADLFLTMTAAPSPVAAGGLLIYTITVKNDGPDAASSPVVSLGTPVGTTYESSTKPANWTCANPSSSPTVSCSGPTMPAGTTVVLTLSFRVKAGASGSITGTAGVSSSTNDPFSADNAATVVTGIGPGGSLPFKRFVIMVAKD